MENPVALYNMTYWTVSKQFLLFKGSTALPFSNFICLETKGNMFYRLDLKQKGQTMVRGRIQRKRS